MKRADDHMGCNPEHGQPAGPVASPEHESARHDGERAYQTDESIIELVDGCKFPDVGGESATPDAISTQPTADTSRGRFLVTEADPSESG
jgi:hypothetical protein